VIPLDDSELLKICETENEHRGNLFLRNITGHGDSMGSMGEDARSIKKLHKFFGLEPNAGPVSSSPNKRALVIDPRAPIRGPQRTTSLFSPSPTLKSKNNKNLSAFFGERPPDELIVDQLEQFFPGISVGKDSALSPEHNSIKNIVEANLKQKRSSKRGSALMLRRQTQNIENLLKDSSISKKQSKVITSPVIPEVAETIEVPSIPTSTTLNDDSSDALDSPKNTRVQSIPTPITFRWTPGRLIGQGAFGKVFHALNLDTGEFMAVKQVLSGQEAQHKKQNDSLQREIEMLRDLHHDNIVRYIGT
jgi:hypothetical protein